MKLKRVSLNETSKFPFWGVYICVDFNLRNQKTKENVKKLDKIIFLNTNIDIYKTD